jgi:hypothetical protein
MRFSPWFAVARAATLLTGPSDEDVSVGESYAEAAATAERAHDALREPAKLHGIDQLLQGIALAIKGDAETELQKIAYYDQTAPAPKPWIEPAAITEAA